jgi:hypothetical protein
VKEGGPANTGHAAAAAAVDGVAARQVVELLMFLEDTNRHGRVFGAKAGPLHRKIMIATLDEFCIYC